MTDDSVAGDSPRAPGSAAAGGSRVGQARRGQGAVSRSIKLRRRISDLEAQLGAAAGAQLEAAASLDRRMERLDKQIARVGKEQFRANALAESRDKTIETALEKLDEASLYRERELAQLRERLATARDAGTMDVVRRLLPTLDGLDDALAAGRRQVERMSAPAPQKPSWLEMFSPAARAARAAGATELPAAGLAAWLEGLTFVRERLLETLAAYGVEPIDTEGKRFDPHLHLAVETEPAAAGTPAGAIVRVHRCGYVHEETVLRFAEVVVARTPQGAGN